MGCNVDCWNTVGVRGTATCEKLTAVAHCRNCPEYIAAGRMLLDRNVPDGAPEEWTRLIAEPRQARQPVTVSVVVFRIGAEWLALKTVLFEQVVTVRVVHNVPSRTNRVFQGLVNIDGELLLCFSAGEALGLENANGDASSARRYRRLLVAARGGQRLAFPVEEVLGVRSLSPDHLAPVPATLANAPGAVTTSIFSVGEYRVGLLNEERFFERMTKALTP